MAGSGAAAAGPKRTGAKPAPADRPLTAQQQRFVDEYLLDLNATQAAIRAGYSAKTAEQQGARLTAQPHVAAAIRTAQAERAERTKIDQDYVLRQAVKLHERCMQEVVPFTDRKGDHVHDEEGHPLYTFNANGAAKALELVGKHIAIQAFKEKVEHSGGVTVEIVRLG